MDKILLVYSLPVFALAICIDFIIDFRLKQGNYNLVDSLASISVGLFSTVCGVLVFGYGLFVYDLVYKFWHISWPNDDALYYYLCAIVVYDFNYYWMHRVHHEVRLLWAIHTPHHSSEYINFTTALRQSALGFLTMLPCFFPMALLGFNYQAYALGAAVSVLYGFFTHTRRVGYLPVEGIFIGPATHRLHHATNKGYIDKNYGSILSIWDRIFGTHQIARGEERMVFGVVDPLNTVNPLATNLCEFKKIFVGLGQHTGTWQRMKYLLGKPSKMGGARECSYGYAKRLQVRSGTARTGCFLALTCVACCLTGVLVAFGPHFSPLLVAAIALTSLGILVTAPMVLRD